MADLHAYRASDELAGALREYRQRQDEFGARVVAFDQDHPGHELLWIREGFAAADDKRAVGFVDGTDDVPDGLSRAKTRTELRPKKTKAGKPWQDVLDAMNSDRPKVSPVLRQFDVPTAAEGGPGPHFGSFRIAPTQWGDAGGDGVIVYAFAPLTRPVLEDEQALSPHLTPVPLSEFYAIKERLEATATESTETEETTR